MDEWTLVGRYVLTSYSVGSVTLDRGNSQSPQSRIPPRPALRRGPPATERRGRWLPSQTTHRLRRRPDRWPVSLRAGCTAIHSHGGRRGGTQAGSQLEPWTGASGIVCMKGEGVLCHQHMIYLGIPSLFEWRFEMFCRNAISTVAFHIM